MGNCGSSEANRRQRDSERAAAALVDAIDSLEQVEPPPANDAPGRVSMVVDLFKPDASCHLGLALTGDRPCTITAVQPNGVASNILLPGDQLFSVNGVEVLSGEDAGRLLSQPGSVLVPVPLASESAGRGYRTRTYTSRGGPYEQADCRVT